MTSTNMMIGLVIIYFIIFCVCLFEKNFITALYWLGAILLNIAVIIMAMGMK